MLLFCSRSRNSTAKNNLCKGNGRGNWDPREGQHPFRSNLSLLGAQHKKGIVWRASRQACLLCPWAWHLTGRLHLYMADRWPTRTSPDYNCEVANPACRKRRLLGTHQWQSALLVVGLPVTHDWLEMGCHLSPSLISIRLTA